MKKRTQNGLMATPCPKRNVKRPMSQNSSVQKAKPIALLLILLLSLNLTFLNKIQAQTTQQLKEKTSSKNNQTTYLLKGKVIDTQNLPLPGAAIIETGTQNSTSTDPNGNFQLSTSEATGTLTISYLGFQSTTLRFDINRLLTITLTEDLNRLQQIEINTGYYSVSQKQLTGSISGIKAAQIEKQPVTNPIQALQGRIAGAYIQQNSGTPGASINLNIRGRNSLESSNNPLYLIDGIPFGSQTLTSSLSSTISTFGAAGASPFNTLSPSDIESIDILKDADATAIYGSRGANGVVLITTKKGKGGKTKIELNGQSGLSQITRTLPMLTTPQYLALRRQAFDLDGLSPKATDYDLNGTWDQNRYTNWQSKLLDNPATFSTTSLSVSGGNAQHSFLLSGAYHHQTSPTDKTLSYNRASAHLAASHQSIDQKFSASFSLNYSADHNNWFNEGLTGPAMALAPNAPALYQSDGKLNWENGTWENPLRSLERTYQAQNTNLLASSTLSYRPIRNLEIKADMGYNNWSLADYSTSPVSFYNPAEGRSPATSTIDQNNSTLSSWSIQPQASYQKNTSFGTFNLLLGTTLQSQQKTQTLMRGTGFSTDALIENIQAASAAQVRGYSNPRYSYLGTFARFNYTLNERYILNLTARRDGSSRFGPGRKFANFGAIGAAYLFSEESKVQNLLPQLSLGKLRISYGTSGNDQIGDYEYLDNYQSGIGYNGAAGLSPLRLFNPDFGWESSRKLELGLDLGFFKDRLRTTFAYYHNRSSSQLIDYPLASTTGFTSIRNNLAATIQNTGLEIELQSDNLKSGRLQWSTSVNFTIPRNKLIAFPGLENSSYVNTYAIGQPLDIVKAYHYLGVDPLAGVYRFRDFNGDGVISAADDRKQLVRRGQTFYGGIDNNLSCGGFSLSLLVQVVRQRAVTFRALNANAPGLGYNQPKANQGKYWQQPGDQAQFQRLTSGANTAVMLAHQNYAASDAAIGDASFIRLKNLSFSYRTDKLLKGAPLRLFLQGQNLLTFTGYFGLDPENANQMSPLLKTFTMGFQLSL